MWRAALRLLILSAALTSSACARPPRPGDPIDGLSPEERARFDRGRALFERRFIPEEGLGPSFNAPACGECHEEPVSGGVGDEVETHISLVRPDGGCDPLVDRGGPVIQAKVTPALEAALGITTEPIPGDLVPAHRTTPDLFGFGLLDTVPESAILAYADPDDRDHDGISGRPHRTAEGRVGRFGRKAQVASLRPFNDDAFLFEMGITGPGNPHENSLGGQPIPDGVDPAPDPEIDEASLKDLDAFVRLLAPPAPLALDHAGRRGRKLFERIGCDRCHLPVLKTGSSPIAALDHRKFAPYTDLLLHDMGPDLADICLGDAAPSEFRTEPLMGLHLATRFLHDGRAASIEEAIRLHAGEGTRARDGYEDLDAGDRKALLLFLKSL
jgi:CxxC motif-containing protein (DUF1111 family)